MGFVMSSGFFFWHLHYYCLVMTVFLILLRFVKRPIQILYRSGALLRLWWKKLKYCWNYLYRFSKAFSVTVSSDFCCEQLFFTLWSFRSDCLSFFVWFLSVGWDLKKDFCWNWLYRFSKAFVVIVSTGFCCEQLSFTLWSLCSDCDSDYGSRLRLV